MSKNTSNQILVDRANDPDWKVRLWVANDSNLPLETLKLLSEDPVWYVSNRAKRHLKNKGIK